MSVKKTPLSAWHENQGGTMADFAGWSMPLWYPTGARSEHMSVITDAGLFDTSHMDIITVTGPGASELLQLCFTRDLRACVGKGDLPLESGRCVYGAFLNERGELIDDAIVYQFIEHEFMVVVNAGMGEEVARHLKVHAPGRDVEVTNSEQRIAKLDLQGPKAARVLKKVLRDPDDVLARMPYFSFKGHFDANPTVNEVLLSDGTPILVSRTGYTGEFGFEIFVAAEHVVRAWEMILSTGEELSAIACGLAARDSLRTGAVLPLSHQDIGSWPFINHPWHFALPFDATNRAFTKKFIGDIVLELMNNAEHTHVFVGYDPRKVSIQDPAAVLDSEGRRIGMVTTCVADLAIGRDGDRIYSVASPDRPEGFKPRGLCCGFVRVASRLDAGQPVELEDRRRTIKVRIVDDIRPDRTARRPLREFV